MAVALRLSRGGSNKRPFYRIVAADVRSPRDGRYIERLGTYNPMKPKDHSERLTIKKERIKYWLSVGAKPTDRVAKFLAAEGMIEKPKIYEQTKQDKPRAKTLEKLKAKEEKMKNAASAATEAPAPTAAEAPAPAAAEASAPDAAEPPAPAAAEAPAPAAAEAPAPAAAESSTTKDKNDGPDKG